MIIQVDPSIVTFSRSEQIISLIRQNASLEVKLASYHDVEKIHQRLQDREEVKYPIIFKFNLTKFYSILFL